MQIENEYLHSLKSKSAKRPIGFEDLPEAAPGGVTNSLLEFKKNGKKKCVPFWFFLSFFLLYLP